MSAQKKLIQAAGVALLAPLTWLSLRELLIRYNRMPMAVTIMRDDAILPRQSTSGSAGMDIASPDSFIIEPGETKIIDLGYSYRIPRSFYVSLQTRSSMSIKHGIVLANGTEGVIDSDYRDSIKLALLNRSNQAYTVERGDRVAQLLFKRHYSPYQLPVEHFDVRYRYPTDAEHSRQGGLGSTGI